MGAITYQNQKPALGGLRIGLQFRHLFKKEVVYTVKGCQLSCHSSPLVLRMGVFEKAIDLSCNQGIFSRKWWQLDLCGTFVIGGPQLRCNPTSSELQSRETYAAVNNVLRT